MPQSSKSYLFIINNAPYGDERPYNASRLALNLIKRAGNQVSVFMTGDGVFCARKGQKTPEGYYNIERMVAALARRGRVAIWGSCCEARGFGPEDMAEGIIWGNQEMQGDWVVEADQVIVY